MEIKLAQKAVKWGFDDGVSAGERFGRGETVDHGNLFKANDPYAIGYRKGYYYQRKKHYDSFHVVEATTMHDVFQHDNYQHPESMEYQNTYYDGN